MKVNLPTLPPPRETSIPHRHDPRPRRSHSFAIFQAVDPTMFDTELEQWLESLPLTSFVAGGKLPPPGEVLCRPGYNNNDVRLQRDLFLAVSGTVSTTLDTVRLSIRAPPSLFLSAHRPMLSIWLPIINWGYVRPWTVMEALQHAARSLLRPYDPTETLCRQIIAKIFVSIALPLKLVLTSTTGELTSATIASPDGCHAHRHLGPRRHSDTESYRLFTPMVLRLGLCLCWPTGSSVPSPRSWHQPGGLHI